MATNRATFCITILDDNLAMKMEQEKPENKSGWYKVFTLQNINIHNFIIIIMKSLVYHGCFFPYICFFTRQIPFLLPRSAGPDSRPFPCCSPGSPHPRSPRGCRCRRAQSPVPMGFPQHGWETLRSFNSLPLNIAIEIVWGWLTVCYWTWSFRVDSSIDNGDFSWVCWFTRGQ